MATGQLFMLVCLCYLSSRFADAYDPVDPNGNVVVSWDFQSIGEVYTVMVSVRNNQLYRHIESPGWRLSWEWAGDEVIWGTTGSETTEQGNCSAVKAAAAAAPPHCCSKHPVMVDLPPGTPDSKQVANCCRGGVLSSLTQNSGAAASAFQMYVGNFATDGDGGPEKPTYFSIGAPGYTCSNATEVPPTRFKVDGQRHVQALLTWQVVCTYSQFRDAPAPSCCVSLSAFYNSTVVGCSPHTCGGSTSSPTTSPAAAKCLSGSEPPPDADGRGGEAAAAAAIQVSWHVKRSYRGYWRVKMAVTNHGVARNYTGWNLVVQHPNLGSIAQLFSFSYRPLIQYGDINDTGMFWGIKNYNEMLLQGGNVQSEMLLEKKDTGGGGAAAFTFSGGWAFPRRVYFNGRHCTMPPPHLYPSLPNGGSPAAAAAGQWLLAAGSCLLWLLAPAFLM